MILINVIAVLFELILDGVVRAEVLLNAKREPNKFDDIGKIGLFARARMFLDAQNPVVVKIWTPNK